MQHLFTLLHMSLVMALALCAIAMDSQRILSSYVDHADFPGSSFVYLVDIFEQSPIITVDEAMGTFFIIMTFGIQIWRLWIVWSATQYARLIIVLPILALLANIVLQVFGNVTIAQSGVTLHLDVVLTYGLAATQLCTSVTITVSIIVRILMVRRKHLKLIGQTDTSNPYTSVISMLIESFALECVWVVAQLCSYNASTPAGISVDLFFNNTNLPIQLLAYLLVVHRVCTKRAWERDTGEKLTTLQWNQNGLQTTHISTRVAIPKTDEEA